MTITIFLNFGLLELEIPDNYKKLILSTVLSISSDALDDVHLKMKTDKKSGSLNREGKGATFSVSCHTSEPSRQLHVQTYQ